MRPFLFGIIFMSVLGCGNGVPDLTLTGVCDGYPDWTTSPYVVPWEAGTSHKIGQGNCGPASHYGRDKYAYDVEMPIGTNIVAIRGGTVDKVVEDKSDGNGCSAGENHIYITHSDGTTSQYFHLTLNGSLVAEGDVVTQGQVIGLSGNTGCSGGPHLHFQVVTDPDGGISIPITFSNVGANARGLQTGKSYTAN